MRGRGRMNHEALRIANVGEMRKQLQRLNESPPRVEAAFDPERQNSARAAREVAPGQFDVTAGIETRVIRPRDSIMLFEESRDRECVRRVRFHPELQRLDSLE